MKVGALVHMYPPLHNAGAEHMLHGIMAELVRRGVECVVAIEPYGGSPYEIDGVRVGSRVVLARCDVLLTHLDRTPEAEAYALSNGVPLAQIMHNHQRPQTAKVCHLAIYNSHWIADGYPTRGCGHRVVIHPPVWPDLYRVTPGECVTLVNLQKPKGALLFYQLVEAMPDVSFLGVFGAYGCQEPAPSLGNLATLSQQSDMRRVYERTRVLLMPSTYESYGRCAIEAAVSGIPTIANSTPGLREALGGSGVFPAGLNVDSWKVALRDVLAHWDVHSRRALELSKTLDPGGDIDRLLVALTETAARGSSAPKIVRVHGVARLHYPIRIAHDCHLGGKHYPRGSAIDRETALALKADGQLKDSRIV